MKDTGKYIVPPGIEHAIMLGDVEPIAFRFYLATRLAKMHYGECVALTHIVVHHAWPPTGDHDTSFEGLFRAVMLAGAGHRPEPSYTTQERIERDLDETFHVERMEYDRERRWLIERRIRCCQKCHGDGYFEEWDLTADRPSPMEIGQNVTEMTVSKKRFTCEHKP